MEWWRKVHFCSLQTGNYWWKTQRLDVIAIAARLNYQCFQFLFFFLLGHHPELAEVPESTLGRWPRRGVVGPEPKLTLASFAFVCTYVAHCEIMGRWRRLQSPPKHYDYPVWTTGYNGLYWHFALQSCGTESEDRKLRCRLCSSAFVLFNDTTANRIMQRPLRRLLSLQCIWEIYWLWPTVKSLQRFASNVKASQAQLLKTSVKICPSIGMIRGFCQVHWRTAGRLELSFQRTDLEAFIVMTWDLHDPKTQSWRWVCKSPEECGFWCDFDFQFSESL